jgi:hypothetical protein
VKTARTKSVVEIQIGFYMYSVAEMIEGTGRENVLETCYVKKYSPFRKINVPNKCSTFIYLFK